MESVELNRQLGESAGRAGAGPIVRHAVAADLAAAGVELGKTYPAPVVRHDRARERTLRRYEAVRKPG